MEIELDYSEMERRAEVSIPPEFVGLTALRRTAEVARKYTDHVAKQEVETNGQRWREVNYRRLESDGLLVGSEYRRFGLVDYIARKQRLTAPARDIDRAVHVGINQ
jgi:hypothetical protein